MSQGSNGSILTSGVSNVKYFILEWLKSELTPLGTRPFSGFPPTLDDFESEIEACVTVCVNPNTHDTTDGSQVCGKTFNVVFANVSTFSMLNKNISTQANISGCYIWAAGTKNKCANSKNSFLMNSL